MGNWTDRFDPETVDEIKRFEVGEGDFLLAERLAMHKGVESVFGFHVNCLGLGKPYWEKGVYLGDVLDFFDRHGGILLKPITTEKEITGHIGDTILSWCEKGQKDDGGNEFRD